VAPPRWWPPTSSGRSTDQKVRVRVPFVLAALRSYDLKGPEAIHAARRLRVFIHGSRSSPGGFGLIEDPAETYEHLIQVYLATLTRS
jgi:hypothetical protein